MPTEHSNTRKRAGFAALLIALMLGFTLVGVSLVGGSSNTMVNPASGGSDYSQAADGNKGDNNTSTTEANDLDAQIKAIVQQYPGPMTDERLAELLNMTVQEVQGNGAVYLHALYDCQSATDAGSSRDCGSPSMSLETHCDATGGWVTNNRDDAMAASVNGERVTINPGDKVFVSTQRDITLWWWPDGPLVGRRTVHITDCPADTTTSTTAPSTTTTAPPVTTTAPPVTTTAPPSTTSTTAPVTTTTVTHYVCEGQGGREVSDPRLCRTTPSTALG